MAVLGTNAQIMAWVGSHLIGSAFIGTCLIVCLSALFSIGRRLNADVEVRLRSIERGDRSSMNNEPSCSTSFKIHLTVFNHGPSETDFGGVTMDGRKLTPPVEFTDLSFHLQNPPLPVGKTTDVWLLGNATVHGVQHWSDVGKVSFKKVKIELIDGFLQHHEVRQDHEEYLNFEPR